MPQPTLYIMTTASAEKGWGHLSRCINIYHSAKTHYQVYFILRDTDPQGLARAQQNNVNIIDEPDFSRLTCAAGDAVLIDNYAFGKDQLNSIKKRGFITIEINDIPQDAKGADVLINHTPGILQQSFPHLETRLYLLGESYLLINPLFYEVTPTTDRPDNTILVLIGATDPLGITQHIIRAARHDNRQYHFLRGAGNAAVEETREPDHLHFHSGLNQAAVRDLMLTCRSVITTASTSALEAICCGCAVFAGTTADNQLVLAEHLSASNLICNLGNIRDRNWEDILPLITEKSAAELVSNTADFRQSVRNNKLDDFFSRLSRGNLWT